MVERLFLASLCASWAKNSGDSLVRGIKGWRSSNLRSYGGKLHIKYKRMVAFTFECVLNNVHWSAIHSN